MTASPTMGTLPQRPAPPLPCHGNTLTGAPHSLLLEAPVNKTYGYAARDAVSKLAPFEFQRRDLRDHDVQMDVLFCGVCHSDLHTARNEWKNTVYPVVPGHEIVGRVTAVGPQVSHYKVGDL